MPKKVRPLGQDRPNVFQGVPAVDTFPKPNLGVTLDDILDAQETSEAAPPSPIEQPQASPQLATSEASALLDVPVDLIDDAKFQPRLVLSDDEQDRLTTSIAVAGRVNRPILLRRLPNGRYELLGGTTRLKSVRTLGWRSIPARIVDVDDAEAEILALSDNEGHKELTDFEKGRAYSRILTTGKVKSARSLAERLGTSPATVTRCLAFMKLPANCVSYLEQSPNILGSKLISEFVEISQSHPELVHEALVKIDQEGVSQEAALRWLSAAIAATTGTKTKSSSQSSSIELDGFGPATIVRRKDTFNLKLPKGVDMDVVETAIRKAIESIR